VRQPRLPRFFFNETKINETTIAIPGDTIVHIMMRFYILGYVLTSIMTLDMI